LECLPVVVEAHSDILSIAPCNSLRPASLRLADVPNVGADSPDNVSCVDFQIEIAPADGIRLPN
jgi:hypothetical protein